MAFGGHKKENIFATLSMSTNTPKPRQTHITVVHGMRDYSKDPFVLEKLEKARAFIAKNGRPNTSKPKKSK
jgi:hypothetical protein